MRIERPKAAPNAKMRLSLPVRAAACNVGMCMPSRQRPTNGCRACCANGPGGSTLSIGRMPQHSRIRYRPDIDGLRAIAVLAVIGFHASPRFVPGGFVGVDVFFVISGFLISGILFTQMADGTFEFAEFYARRVRRIFPAVAVVLAACWVVGWFTLVQDEYRELEKHVAAGATFLSNFLLWGEAGYFDAPSELKPLLHLWSLGVEEQFYLIWPPLLYLLWKRGLNVASSVVSIIAVSFLLNVSLVGASAIATFYSPQTRLWELMVGGLAAYVECFHKARVESSVKRLVFTSPDRYDDLFIANLKAGIGLALIVLAIVLLGKSPTFPGWWFSIPALHPFAAILGLDKPTAYPGWWATLPVAGTALVIWAGAGAWINRAILERRGLVYIGLISYPLYLWHWPLLSFVRITESGNPSRAIRVCAVALSFLLAWLTYEVIERPIRKTTSLRTPLRLAALAATLVAIASVSFYSYKTDAFSSRTPRFATTIDSRLASPRHDSVCNQKFPTAGEYCQEYATGVKVTTALVGDSHAEHFLSGVGAYLLTKHENVVHLGQSGCPPLLDVERSSYGTHDTCHDANNSVIAFVLNNNDLTRVILSFRGVVDVTGTGFGDPESGLQFTFKVSGTDLSPGESMLQALGRTVGLLLRSNKTVWLLLQVPELDFRVEECIGRPFSFGNRIRTPCAVPKTKVIERQAAYRQIVSDVQRKHPALHVFDPLPFLCDEQWCYAIVDHSLMYRDNNHLSRTGSLFLSRQFAF
jgi:peptidoglycan/LPS O-acetylase OafA/YrhL